MAMASSRSWFVGALIFFLIPVVESLIYSFQEIQPGHRRHGRQLGRLRQL